MSGFPPIEPILITSFVAAAAVGASGWLVQAAEGERPVDSYPIEIRPMLLFIQRLFQGFRDRRDSRLQVRRRRLAARLTPVESERGWLLEILPPEITQAVLTCLDSSSMKSLRATSRQCHQVVSEHTTRLVLAARGVQHFTTVPLYKVYPSLTEVAIGRGVHAMQIIELLQARGLEHLELTLLDLSRCTAQWTVARWRSFLMLLPDGLHIKLNPRCLANEFATGAAGPASLKYNRNGGIYSSISGLISDARDVALALLLLARLQPSTVVELEGPDGASVVVNCDSQKALEKLCRCRQTVKIALEFGHMPSWSQWNFGCLKDLSNLTQLSVKAEDPKVTLALLQALETACPLLTTLRLRSSVLSAACLPALAAIPGLRNLQVASILFLLTPETTLPNLHRLVVTGTVQLPDDLPLAGLAPALQALSLFPAGVTLPFRLMQATPIPTPAPAAAAPAPHASVPHMGPGNSGASSASQPPHPPHPPPANPHLAQQQQQQLANHPQHQNPNQQQHHQHLHHQPSSASNHTTPQTHHPHSTVSPSSCLPPSNLIELSLAASTFQQGGKIDRATVPGLSRLLNDPLALQQLQRFRVWRVLDTEDLHKVLELVVASAGVNLREVELHHCCVPPPPRPTNAVYNNSSLVRGGTGNLAANGCGPFFRYTARQVLTNAQDIPRAMTTAGQMLGMTPGEAAMQPAASLLMGVESLTLVEGGGASFVKGMAMHALQHAMTEVLSLPWGAAAAGTANAANALSSRLAAQRQIQQPPSEEYETSEGGGSEDEETEGSGSDDSGSEEADEDEGDSVTGSDYSASSVTETSTAASSRACEVVHVEDMALRLQTLRLVNVSGLTMGSLALLMRHAPQLKKLELCGCPGVTLEWIMQARIDAGRRLLTIDFAGV